MSPNHVKVVQGDCKGPLAITVIKRVRKMNILTFKAIHSQHEIQYSQLGFLVLNTERKLKLSVPHQGSTSPKFWQYDIAWNYIRTGYLKVTVWSIFVGWYFCTFKTSPANTEWTESQLIFELVTATAQLRGVGRGRLMQKTRSVPVRVTVLSK